MTALVDKLLEHGLTYNEAQVYLSVLKAAECSIGTVERATSLHRQLIYNAATGLAEKGLLRIERRGGRRRFIAADPQSFEEVAAARFAQARALARELATVRKTSGFAGEARVYKGGTEIQRYYLDAISYQPIGSRVDILGTEDARYFELFPLDSLGYRLFEQRRIERRVRWRLLLAGPKHKNDNLNAGRPFLDMRTVRKGVTAPIDIMVWCDHVGMLVYGDLPTVIDIPGEAPARGFRKYFSLLWEHATLLREI